MMDRFTYQSTYGTYSNCWFEVGMYENGNTAITIMSPEEGPISKVTVNPEVIIPEDMIAVKNYSENEGMAQWLRFMNFVEAEPEYTIYSGWVEIPVYKLTEQGKQAIFK